MADRVLCVPVPDPYPSQAIDNKGCNVITYGCMPAGGRAHRPVRFPDDRVSI